MRSDDEGHKSKQPHPILDIDYVYVFIYLLIKIFTRLAAWLGLSRTKAWLGLTWLLRLKCSKED